MRALASPSSSSAKDSVVCIESRSPAEPPSPRGSCWSQRRPHPATAASCARPQRRRSTSARARSSRLVPREPGPPPSHAHRDLPPHGSVPRARPRGWHLRGREERLPRTRFPRRHHVGRIGPRLENNNVYAVEPRMYVQGENGEEEAVDDVGSDMGKMDPGTLAISIAGVAALALGGSRAVCVFYENYFAPGAPGGRLRARREEGPGGDRRARRRR